MRLIYQDRSRLREVRSEEIRTPHKATESFCHYACTTCRIRVREVKAMQMKAGTGVRMTTETS
jgi:hypothetical protein